MTPQSKTVQIPWKDGNAVSTPAIAANCNLFFDAIRSVGMVRVSNVDYAGQTEGIVTSAPVPPNWKLYTRPSAAVLEIIMYQVFKHPVLQLYIKVSIGIRAIGSSGAFSCMYLKYDIFTSLNNGAESGEVLSIEPNTPIGGTTVTSNHYPTKSLNLKLYCDDDTFWVSSEPTVYNYAADSYEYSLMPASAFSLFIQKSDKGAVMLLSTSPNGYSTSPYGGVDNANSDGEKHPFSPRRWMLKGGMFTRHAVHGDSFATLPEHLVASNEFGIRVFRASAHDASGLKHSFNFGTANSSVVMAGTPLVSDLDGNGDRSYMPIDAFGATAMTPRIGMSPTTVPSWVVATQVSLLLPWVVM